MTAKILRLPSRGLFDVRKEVIRADRATSERPNFRHVRRAGTTPPALPVTPHLTHRADAGSSSFKRQIMLGTPLAKGMIGLAFLHTSPSKPIAYHLTSGCTEMHGSIVSADIVHLMPMDQAPNRIRELRTQAGLSQEQLGERIGVHKMTVSDLERGKIELTLSYMRRVADALCVTPADILLTRDDPSRLNEVEKELLEAFRASPEVAREFLLASAKAVADTAQAA